MWFDGAKQSRFSSTPLCYSLVFLLAFGAPVLWSHLQMIVGACDCPILANHSPRRHRYLFRRLTLLRRKGSIIGGALLHHILPEYHFLAIHTFAI
jgi:hypothetical protein